MGSFAKHVILTHANLNKAPHLPSTTTAPAATRTSRRSAVVWTASFLVSAMLEVRRPPPPAEAESWGTRSFIWEKYFSPGLSPEEAVARIRQTTEGMHDMRHMLDTLSWRYVMFFIRLKSAYLDSDLKNAMATLPENRRRAYVKVANEVVDNMSELDRYVRSPKVYESYVYYEKALKSLDDLLVLLT
uniref:Photosynthetic NDH subcomplex L 2 n=1 Tax=Habenaria pantlingiana TaxID=1498489 RepID=A0A0F7GX53_9ASPA